MALKRSDVKRPVLRKRAVQVDALGGEVVVRALLASERWALFGDAGDATDVDALAARIAQGRRLADMLALAVMDAEDKPIFSGEEWEMFGADSPADMALLVNSALQLSGIGEDTEKNSDANPS